MVTKQYYVCSCSCGYWPVRNTHSSFIHIYFRLLASALTNWTVKLFVFGVVWNISSQPYQTSNSRDTKLAFKVTNIHSFWYYNATPHSMPCLSVLHRVGWISISHFEFIYFCFFFTLPPPQLLLCLQLKPLLHSSWRDDANFVNTLHSALISRLHLKRQLWHGQTKAPLFNSLSSFVTDEKTE